MPSRRLRLSAVLAAALALSAAGVGSAAALVDPGTGYSYETTSVVVPMTFPIATSAPTSYADNFLACRSGCSRMHMGQDLMGAKMTPVLAAFDGTVTSLKRETSPGQGNYVVITADRGPAKGWSAIYVHVNNDTPGTDDGRGTVAHAFPGGIELGTRVLEGQLVAWRGDSGNAESTAPHIHFELRKTTPEGRSGWGGTVYNAYPSLQAARRLAAPTPSGPHPEGSLLSQRGALWVVAGGAKRAIDPLDLAVDGRSRAHAIPITDAEAAYYPTGAPWPLRDGAVVRDGAGVQWLLHGGTRSIVTPTTLRALGLTEPVVHGVSAASLLRTPVRELPVELLRSAPPTPTITWSGLRSRLAPSDPATLAAGTLVRESSSTRVYLVERSGALRPVPGLEVLASHGYHIRDVALRPSLAGLPRGPELSFRDGTLVRRSGDHRLGVTAGGAFRPIHDLRQLQSYGYAAVPVLDVPAPSLKTLRTAELAGS